MSQSAAALLLVREGLGVAVLENFPLGASLNSDLDVRPFTPETKVTYRQILSNQHALTRTATAFTDRMVKE